MPKDLENASERVDEPLEQKDEVNSPEGTLDELDAPGDEADALGASRSVEDDGGRPMKLRNASERERERSKRRSRKYSPGRPGEEPDEPDGETVVPGDVHSTQEGPRGEGNQRVDDANASDRDTQSRGCRSDQVESRGVEGVRDRQRIVDRAGYDGICPKCDRNERDGGTDARTRETGPLGHRGEQVELGGDEVDRERQSCGNGDDTDGSRGVKDGATSGTRRDSKRVETGPLAENETSQHEQRERKTAHVPRRSTPPTIDPRQPIDHPNPPRRRRRLKTNPRGVSTRRRTYQDTRTRRDRIGRIRGIGDVVYRLEMAGKYFRGAVRTDEATGVDRGRPRVRTSARTLAEARLTISGNRSSAARRDHTDSFTRTRNSFVYQYIGILSFDFIFYL